MITEQENADALAMFQAFEAEHLMRQAQRAADMEEASLVRNTVLRTHPETMSLTQRLAVIRMLTAYLESYRSQIQETSIIAERRYEEMRGWYEYAGLLPQTTNPQADQVAAWCGGGRPAQHGRLD